MKVFQSRFIKRVTILCCTICLFLNSTTVFAGTMHPKGQRHNDDFYEFYYDDEDGKIEADTSYLLPCIDSMFFRVPAGKYHKLNVYTDKTSPDITINQEVFTTDGKYLNSYNSGNAYRNPAYDVVLKYDEDVMVKFSIKSSVPVRIIGYSFFIYVPK